MALLPFIDNLEVAPFQKTAHLWFASQHYLHQLPDHLLLVTLSCGRVPLLQSQLALPAEQQHEAHLHAKTEHPPKRQCSIYENMYSMCRYMSIHKCDNQNYWPSKGTFPVNCILVPNYESLHHSFLSFALFVNIIIKSDIINNFCVQMLFQFPKAKKYRDVIKS